MLVGSTSPLVYLKSVGVLISSARRQLAFDIWWLAFALWLVCIIEVCPRCHMSKFMTDEAEK
jgi:hypothetical protein